jgi:hypothetical protein
MVPTATQERDLGSFGEPALGRFGDELGARDTELGEAVAQCTFTVPRAMNIRSATCG